MGTTELEELRAFRDRAILEMMRLAAEVEQLRADQVELAYLREVDATARAYSDATRDPGPWPKTPGQESLRSRMCSQTWRDLNDVLAHRPLPPLTSTA